MNATLIERLKALAEWHDTKSALFVSFVDAVLHADAAATIREAIAELEGERE